MTDATDFPDAVALPDAADFAGVVALTVLTTTDSAAKAEELARGAVEARLAACAQISAPVTSVFHWRDAVETTREWQVLFKTVPQRYAELEAHLIAAHDYDTPEVLATPVVAGAPAYLTWLTSETTPRT
ncbi:divalent-cation tolerance protein CutA [Streptomyces sp. NPDC017979]|uniref:divalent-cation tolerance protein CutA n=1 Tax=Streptomyces sp. NPDC017979 TaxID=3365024 RepID=UPI00378A19C1